MTRTGTLQWDNVFDTSLYDVSRVRRRVIAVIPLDSFPPFGSQ